MLKVLSRQSLKNGEIICKKKIGNAIDSFRKRLRQIIKADGGYRALYRAL